MLIFRLAVFSFVLRATFGTAFSQTYLFDHFNIGHGLPSNWVTTICQDSKGYLWVGGDGGMAVHNGVAFTPIGSAEGLPVPMIWKLAASRSKAGVFIGTYGGGPNAPRESGVHRIQNGSISPIALKSNSTSHAVFEILHDRTGTLWFGTTVGVFRVHADTASFFPIGTESGVVEILHELKDGSILIGFEKTLYRYTHLDTGAHIQIVPVTNPAYTYTCVVEDEQGTLWFGTSRGEIARVQGNKLTALRSTPAESMNDVAIDKSGNLWFATNQGLIRVQTRRFDQARILHYTTENGLAGNDITTCFIDREDNLWLGGRSTGLSKLAYRNIVRFQLDELHPQVFGNSVAVNDAGHLFTITEEKLWETWRDDDGIWRAWLHEVRHVVPTPTVPGQFIGGMSIDISKDGMLWVAFRWGGLRSYRVTRRPGNHSILTPANTLRPGIELPHGSATGIFIDNDNVLWYNIRGGPMARIDLATMKLLDTIRVAEGTMQAILPTKDDSVWIGAFKAGISVLARNSGTYNLARRMTTGNGLVSDRIRSMIQRRNGDIWIGTRFDGIVIYRDGKFRSLGSAQGLLNNAVWKIVEDEEGRVWVGTSVGLQYTDPDGDLLHTHPRLSGKQVGGLGTVHGRKMLWVTYEGELAIYDYGSDKEPKAPPLIEIAGLRVNGIDRNVHEDLVLPYDENFCVIRFSGLSFRDEGGLQHRYRLLGLDTTWSEPTSQRIVTFGSLRSGTYTFEVHALTADGTQSARPASLSFVILPPWYLSPWTIGLYVLFGGLFVFLYIKFRTRKLEQHSRELERLVSERTSEVVEQRNRLREQAEHLKELDVQKSHFFANISHEFRTPLTVILGHLDRLMKKNAPEYANDYDVMDRNARRLLHFINQLLDLSKIEAGGITLRTTRTNVAAFTKRTVTALSSYASHKGISLTFNGAQTDSPGESAVFAYIDQDKIEKVLVNLISNALKFTPRGGTVDVSLASGVSRKETPGEFVEIAVSDTGAGIPAQKLPYVFDRFYQVEDYSRPGYEGTGIGLALVKELVELHHGSVEVQSTEGKGTTFTISLPLGTAHLDQTEIAEEESIPSPPEVKVRPEIDSPIIDEPQLKELSDEPRALIVEDNSDLRSLVRNQLSPAYRVIEAENGMAGLRKAEEYLPDIIISDIMMPEMDGYSLCRTLKTNEKTNHIPVILLTAKATTENKLEGLELGADDYLMKPFNPEELQVRVRNLIQLRKQLREKFSSEMLLKPGVVTVPSQHKVFLEKVTSAIEQHIFEEEFSVEALAAEVGMSRSQLHRKLKALTNKGPNELIRSFRLQRAAELIRQDAGSLAEIAYQVGFGSQAHFSRSFGEEFGMSPSDYRKTFSQD